MARAGSWPYRLQRALAPLLEEIAAQPEITDLASIDARAVEPEARRRFRDALERLAPLLREGREYSPPSAVLPADLERMAVAGTEAVISDEVGAGRAEKLPDLLPDLLFTVLARYVGPEAASAEVRRTEADLALRAD